MKDTPKRLPDAELEVMKALWQAGEPLTRPELEARLAQHHWASTTLLALLARLEAKGYVAREKQGRGYLYRAALSRRDYLPVESRSALARLQKPGRRHGRERRPDRPGHRRAGGIPGRAESRPRRDVSRGNRRKKAPGGEASRFPAGGGLCDACGKPGGAGRARGITR